MFKTPLIWLGCAATIMACTAPSTDPKRLEDVDFNALSGACDCLEAAVVMYDHTIDLVLKIKAVSDETRKHNNLGEPSPDALLDSMLMLSEQLRVDLEGPGRDLHLSCKDWVDFNTVGAGEAAVDCDHLETFRAAHTRLNDLKQGAQP